MPNYTYNHYENQYMNALINIYMNGYEDGVNERTGLSTKRLPGVIFQMDILREFPILKTKFVAGKTALYEILWIYQQMSNNIHDLHAHIWDQWADANGSIGKAYGAQIAKPVSIYADPVKKEKFRSYENQTQFVLEYLREFPTGRWGNITLWNVDDLSQMRLVPCCHTVTWNLDGGRLNCVLDQRSGDMPYGVPFNTTQYAELTFLFARDLGVQPGILTHVIADAHIYENQMEGVKTQIENFDILNAATSLIDEGYRLTPDSIINFIMNNQTVDDKLAERIKATNMEGLSLIVRCKPWFQSRNESTSFWDCDPTKCEIVDYHHMGAIDFGDVAV